MLEPTQLCVVLLRLVEIVFFCNRRSSKALARKSFSTCLGNWLGLRSLKSRMVKKTRLTEILHQAKMFMLCKG